MPGNKLDSSGQEALAKALERGVHQRGSRFLVIVPTYNEIENIGELIGRLVDEVTQPIEILVVDDNSPDGTAGVVENLQKSIGNLHLLKRPG